MNTAAVVLLAISVIALIWGVVLFSRITPTPRSRRAIIAQYSPPPGVSVLVGAALVGDRRRSISAQLVDLAVRKHVSILAPLTPSGPHSLRFENADGLDDAERATVRAFFGDRPVRRSVIVPSVGDTTLLQRLRWAQFRAESLLASSGLRTTTSPRRYLLTWLTLALAIALVFVGWPNVLYPLAGALVFVATMMLGNRRINPLTTAGVDVRDHIVGLRFYITLAEADRLRALQSPEGALIRDDIVRLNERLLGWAVLFNLEREWAKVLETRDLVGGGSGDGGYVGDLNSTDLALILAFSADFSGAASDGNLGGDPNDPNTPAGHADTGDGAGDGGSDSSGGGDGGGGDGGGGGGD
jgi:uncharacterized membrane protein YgcG